MYENSNVNPNDYCIHTGDSTNSFEKDAHYYYEFYLASL